MTSQFDSTVSAAVPEYVLSLAIEVILICACIYYTTHVMER